MANKTTIYDIANQLNLTAATVSRALNNNPRISKATKKLVLETARELNYEPNKLALALKKGKSNNVGVVVPYINHSFFSTIIRGIEEELHPKGYHVIISQSHEEEDREGQTIKSLLNAQVEGILISVSRSTRNTEHLDEVVQKGIPLVFFDRKKDISGVSSVIFDDYQGGYQATKHLIELGCSRIGHFSGDRSLEIYQDRYQGYVSALKDHGKEPDQDLVFEISSTAEDGIQAIKSLMALKNPPDAIFSSTDYGALGAITWLKNNSFKIPSDIRVVGFSNEPFTEFMDPPISSMDQSPLEMGRKAAQMFLEQVGQNSKRKEKRIILPPNLIVRESSS
ncbi:LacI family DNA-binding transcriptional regulator [Flagellimonas sp.]|uniref:LacI family DNA-binding transcriptional regulator n=1 Tax=Flagellimonas sp. TaxID=2058762 RepID=UPI003B5214B2